MRQRDLRILSMHSVQMQSLLFKMSFSENNLLKICCTYRSRFCSHVLHEDTAKQLQRKPPAAQQHVVRDHHPHKTTVWTGGNKQETSSSSLTALNESIKCYYLHKCGKWRAIALCQTNLCKEAALQLGCQIMR